jgi:hypothetical protein
MCADFSNSKYGVGVIDPVHATDSSWDRLDPLVTPQILRDHFLFGIPLVSRLKDPTTGKAQVFTNDLLENEIVRAVAMVEADVLIDIFPVKRREKHPFDRNLYESLGYFRLEHRPCSSIDQLAVIPANNIDVYKVPTEWIETAFLDKGQINIVPLTIAFQNGGFIPSQSAGGAFFLSILGQKSWLPAFWAADYTSGYPDGLIPRQVNELIGVYAAMEVLSMLAATYATTTSTSVGFDGMSQGVSGPGPQLFVQRLQELEARRVSLVGKLKSRYGFKLFVGTL